MNDKMSEADPTVVPATAGGLTLERFALYAERSVRLGVDSHVRGGDVGVRTVVARHLHDASAQVSLAKHAQARDVFAPSVALAIYSEMRDVWTSSLTRVQDIGLGEQHEFPAEMPQLPLARAKGGGESLTLSRQRQFSIGPGHYGTVTLLYESELYLAAGCYTFASLKMDERSRLLACPGGVDLRIVGDLWTDRGALIALLKESDKARDFSITVAGSDAPQPFDKPAAAGGDETAEDARCVAVIGPEVRMHALLAAPHGTVLLHEQAHAKGAIAAFDIDLRSMACVELESGFMIASRDDVGPQQLHGYFGVPAGHVGPLVGPVPAETEIPLAFGLPVRDAEGLKTFIASISDPKSPRFRQFITQSEFATTFGASDADYAALQHWAENVAGFTVVATYPNRLLLSIRATAAQIEWALYVNLLFRQRSDGSSFIAVDRDPSLDLGVAILEINGLNDFVAPRSALLNGTGANGAYRAADLRNVYVGVNSPLQALDGSGQVVGIVNFATYDAADVAQYASVQLRAAGAPPLNSPNVTLAAAEGGNSKPLDAEEATADVELVWAMAPGAQILQFQGTTGITSHLDDILHAMATSTPALTVGSCSLGFGFSSNANQAIGQMAANGVSFFCSSGDDGGFSARDNARFVNQTLVGGTILSTNPVSGVMSAPVYPTNYYAGETTWTAGDHATGGGSLNAPIPDYQTGVSMATNNGSAITRNYPDVAMVASNVEICFQGAFIGVSGTSVAAPLWAGFTALVNQMSQQSGGPGRSGFLNPAIYDIGLTRGTADDLYAVCFNDIADGASNDTGQGGFTSVAGYDLCTGWGTPTGALIRQLSSPTPLMPNQPLALIRFVITTGQDDLGGGQNGAGATATVNLANGSTFTLTLKTAAEANWDIGSIKVIDFPIPATDDNGNAVPVLTQTQGIAGVTINLIQHNPDISADNWDIAALGVSLFDPGGPQVCQLNKIGDSELQDGHVGLVRLSKSAGDSGNGPSSPLYKTGSGSGC